MEKYPGWTFANLKRLTVRQIVDILARARPGQAGQARLGLGGNGPSAGLVTAVPGPPSEAKELQDLDNVKAALGSLLSQESYERARAAIKAKYEFGS